MSLTIKIVGVIGMIANSIIVSFGLVALLMGIVFFLIGFPEMKKKSVSSFLNKDVGFIFATLATLLIFIVLVGMTIYLCKALLFTSQLAPQELISLGKHLLITVGVLLGWIIISAVWLLPVIFDKMSLNRKQISIVVIGIICMTTVGLSAVMHN